MSVNLSKYRDSLVAAWKDVLEDKTDTNWALFSYEGQTNDLKVVSKGCQGIEELAEDFNSSKIMYAFVKINDPKTSLPKCVLINWQGEGANVVRKGMCANHLRDVENFFTGAHITINARTEEEVEPDIIISKVSKAGSSYSFKAPRSDVSEPTKPIGTNYQRVNPVREINPKERDQFWLQEEQEEKKRLEEEHKRKEAERIQRDEEIKQRELHEAAQRDAKNLIRDHQIEETKQAERASVNYNNEQERHIQIDDNEKIINQSEVLRQQRKQEAQELIAQRTIDARSIFEQNTSIGQISRRVPEKPVRSSLIKTQSQQNVIENTQPLNVQNLLSSKLITDEQQPSDDESSQFSTIKRSPRDVEKKSEHSPSNDDDVPEISKNNNNLNQENNSIKENRYSKATTHMEEITDQQFVDEVIYHDFPEGPGLQARALYDYQAADDTEITFDPGDVITNIDQVDEGWWQGLGPDGTYGLFPANYVELIQ